MKAKIVNVKAAKVMGMVYKGKNLNGEIPAMWTIFNKRYVELKNADLQVFYGLCYGYESNGDFSYMAGLAVDLIADIPNGMEVVELPAGKYAAFTFKDHISKMGEFWDAIYKIYLPENNLKPLQGMTFELYDERFPINGECDIYIPVE